MRSLPSWDGEGADAPSEVGVEFSVLDVGHQGNMKWKGRERTPQGKQTSSVTTVTHTNHSLTLRKD